MLSIVAFVLVALVALPIGKVAARSDDEDVEHGSPLLLLPEAEFLAPEPIRTASSIGLGDIPLVAALSEDARVALAAASGRLDLDAGEWLVREGDPPGSAYLLRSGRLEVVQGDRLLRTLTPGAVVGELSLLTGEPRSAGVRARRDASLIEVPRAAFDALLDRDPRAARTVLTQVAGQMRTAGTRPTRERPARPHVVAVVGLHAGSGSEDVAHHLKERLATHLTVVDPGVVDADGLARAEEAGDRVVLVADGVAAGGDPAWRDFCLRQSDAVVLVARAGSRVPDTGPVLVQQPDLVVIGEVPLPADRVAWVAGTDAWRLTVVDGDPRAGGGRHRGPAGRPQSRAGARRRRSPGVRARRCAARARGGGVPRQPDRRCERRGGDRRHLRDEPRRRRAGGAHVRRVRRAQPVQRLDHPEARAHPRRPRARVRRPGDRRRGDGGAVPPAVAGEHRPDEPDPPGAPSRAAPRRHPRVVATARAVPADPDRRAASS